MSLTLIRRSIQPIRKFIFGRSKCTPRLTAGNKGFTRTFCDHLSSDGSDSDSEIMDLKKVVSKINKFAPTTLAGSWDNVGVLIEPTPPHMVDKLLLTNDLTEGVMEEAINKGVQMIISYHPPIFAPLKRLTQRSWKERIVIRCVENRVALYSPHTSFDAVVGGVNDWLMQPFIADGPSSPIEAVTSTAFPTPGGQRVEVMLPLNVDSKVKTEVLKVSDICGVSGLSQTQLENDCVRVTLNCTEKALPKVVDHMSKFDKVKDTVEILQLTKPPIPGHGPGRLATLKEPITIQDAVDKVKGHLKLPHVRLALATDATLDSSVKTLAVCAGSGASVLRGIKADLYLTGEMSHHEVLDACHKGATVILCDHSNTERLYLGVFKDLLSDMLDNKVELFISEVDRDPLEVV